MTMLPSLSNPFHKLSNFYYLNFSILHLNLTFSPLFFIFFARHAPRQQLNETNTFAPFFKRITVSSSDRRAARNAEQRRE
uniref:Uncharacterized protein n=1 Tax=Caenorhabditis tropicalis TaxID=1561998 RepID=A0A1I7V4E4_9PELO